MESRHPNHNIAEKFIRFVMDFCLSKQLRLSARQPSSISAIRSTVNFSIISCFIVKVEIWIKMFGFFDTFEIICVSMQEVFKVIKALLLFFVQFSLFFFAIQQNLIFPFLVLLVLYFRERERERERENTLIVNSDHIGADKNRTAYKCP